MKDLIKIMAIILGVCGMVTAQAISENIINNMTLLALNQYGHVKNLENGFIGSATGQPIHYHSAIPNVNQAVIARAIDGNMTVSWHAASPKTSDAVTYIWLAGLGANLGLAHFDLCLNGEKILTFSNEKPAFRITNHDSIQLSFQTTYVDEAQDYFGVMAVTFPKNYLSAAQEMVFSARGHKENSNAWYMTFLSEQFANKFQKTMQKGRWYQLRSHGETASILLPNKFKMATLLVNDKPIELSSRNHFMKGEISGFEFPITIQINNEIFDKIVDANDDCLNIVRNGKVSARFVKQNPLSIDYCEAYFSDLAANINQLQQSDFKTANLHLISSSHQDIAWMDNPENCKIQRDTMILTPAMKLLKTNPEYHYSAEQALMLYEYLDRQPEKFADIQQYCKEGRLEWGASFNQPYEGLWRGESLMRQFYLGRKWLKRTLPGYDPKVYFNVDVPGRTRQMPQIAKKCGVDYMIISRHAHNFFWWKSPDGSKLATYSPGHYHISSDFLRNPVATIISRAPKAVLSYKPLFQAAKLPEEVPILYSSDMARPKNFDDFFDAWQQISIDGKRPQLPQWQYNIFQPVMKTIFEQGKNIPELQGERPNVWAYIHGPTHYRFVTASREGGRLLPVAESFATISALLKEDWSTYPHEKFNKAWKNHLFPDHGLGGQDGYITDQLFKEKSEKALAAAKMIIKDKLQIISKEIKVKSKHNIILFNSMAKAKHDIATATLAFDKGEILNPVLYNADKKPNKSMTRIIQRHSDQSIARAEVTFPASVPSLGYATYYVRNGKMPLAMVQNSHQICENQYYRIELTDGGIQQIFDKELKENLLNTEKFLGFEVLGLTSVGNGAGEFDKVQQPTTAFFERSSKYRSKWIKDEDNHVFTSYLLKTQLENAVLEQSIVIYHQIKKIDFNVSILNWDNEKYREYRLAFPIRDSNSKVTYEVPFGQVTVGEDEIPGAAGERYQQKAKELHPREVLDWISVNNKQFGISFSSAVSVWDYVDVTGLDHKSCLLQPLLLASRKSCHHNGNWFLQPGDHHFKFSMTSHQSGWQKGYQTAKSFNHSFLSVQKKETETGKLPDQFSFLSINNENILLSVLKKAEDSSCPVVRLYNMGDQHQSLNLNWFKNKLQLKKVNGIEESDPQSKKDRKIGPYSIETFLLE